MSKNVVWDYFTKIDFEPSKAQCKECKKILSLGSEKPRFQTVSGLKGHLANCHKEIHSTYLKRAMINRAERAAKKMCFAPRSSFPSEPSPRISFPSEPSDNINKTVEFIKSEPPEESLCEDSVGWDPSDINELVVKFDTTTSGTCLKDSKSDASSQTEGDLISQLLSSLQEKEDLIRRLKADCDSNNQMAARQIPSRMRQIVAKKFGSNFREVAEIVDVPVPSPGSKEVLIRNRFLGINASDINYTAGRYNPSLKPPFPLEFEGIGEVVKAGDEAKTKVGQTVVYSKFGSFNDYMVVDDATVMPVPSCDPAFLTFMVSGLTASISLEKLGDLSPGKTVLVTAAAGGTGQFAVQLAKRAGCHVIGTCSSDDKAEFLKSIGCDRTVNYRKEDLNDVLSQEYPKGVDVVYESVGNEMLDTALKNLAIYGRIIVIGSISNYENSKSETFQQFRTASTVDAPMTLLTKSASLQGFFLTHYRRDAPQHLQKLAKLYLEGDLKVFTDLGTGVLTGPFVGLEKVVDAIEYMYSRKNVGKVIVQLPERSQL